MHRLHGWLSDIRWPCSDFTKDNLVYTTTMRFSARAIAHFLNSSAANKFGYDTDKSLMHCFL